MLVIIVISTLITIITLIVSAAIYLLSLVVDGSDDGPNPEVLAIDAQEFSNTPSSSPAAVPTCDILGHHHHNDEITSPSQELGSGTSLPLGQKLEALVNASGGSGLTNDDAPTAVVNNDKKPTPAITPASSASNSDLRSEETSSISSNDQQQQQQDGNAKKLPADIWVQSPSAQNSALINLLGPVASKQLFDDFDPKEIQLGGTGLHWCKSRKTLDKLIKLGLPLDSVNRRHETPLHVAVRKHSLPLTIGLLCHGASVDCKSDKGETPFLLSCKVNDIFACQMLLVFDSDVNTKDKNGLSARHYVARLCNKHKIHQNQPNSAHLILAMLNEMNAKRCDKFQSETKTTSMNTQPVPKATASGSKIPAPVKPTAPISSECADGCYYSGNYNGNSFDRWPSFERESFYKRHMFSDLIGSCLKLRSSSSSQSKSISDPKVKQSRMLCIDGGGMRGVLVCQLLIEMEKFLKKPMISYFDWIGGTSVGAFLACALVNGTTLKELRRICFDVKDEVFSGTKPYNSKHLERVLKRTYGTTKRLSDIKGRRLAVTTVLADRDPCQLKLFRNYKSPAQVLEQYGYPPSKYDTMSGQAIVKPALIPSLKATLNAIAPNVSTQSFSSVEQLPVIRAVTTVAAKSIPGKTPQSQVVSRRTSAESTLTTSSSAPNDPSIDEDEKDPLLWQAVRASAAAPFFFRPYGPYLDGGIISNNPTLDMMSEFYSCEQVRKFLTQRSVKNDPIHAVPREELELVVSLGTGRGRIVGQQAMVDFGNVATGLATVFSPVELVRSIRAARDMFKKLMHRSCMTDDHILDRAQAWCASLNIPYFRLNPPLASIFSIDDKRDEQLINALWQVKLYCRALKLQMHQLGDLLDEKS